MDYQTVLCFCNGPRLFSPFVVTTVVLPCWGANRDPFGVRIDGKNAAYRRLSAATEDLVRADRELAEDIRRVRLDNAEALSWRPRTRGRRASTSTACSTPMSIVAWRLTERELISTTSTRGARSRGCT
jgi:hypothetical protein